MIRCPFCGHGNPPGTPSCEACGAALPVPEVSAAPGTELEAQVRALMEAGRKIEAIRLYRERTGVGLKAAKDAVEPIERAAAVPNSPTSDVTLETAVIHQLRQGNTIEAIRVFRAGTGAGLQAAKEAVERIGRKHGIAPRGGRGCLGLILLAVILALLGMAAAAQGRTGTASGAGEGACERGMRSVPVGAPTRGAGTRTDRVSCPGS